MITFGTTTLPLVGWAADPQRHNESRMVRLSAIRKLVEGYSLQAVELTLDLAAVYPGLFEAGFYATVADLQQELGFLATVHLPFLWVDLASLNEPIRQASTACMRQAIEVTRNVHVHTYVLHLWGFTTMQIAAQLRDGAQRQEILGALMNQASCSLGELCQILDPRDLCVENLEDPLFDLALPLIEQHGTSICLDVGHLAWQGSSELGFLKRHRDRIREIHLHDATASSTGGRHQIRDHLALGEGQVDYLSFLSEVEESAFNGAVILEVNTQADLEQSLKCISRHASFPAENT